jgi:hypothetical protein
MGSQESLYGRQVKVAGWGTVHNNSVPNALQIGTVTILTGEACSLRVSRLLGMIILGEERLLCTLSYPYVLVRPVSNNLNINVVIMK